MDRVRYQGRWINVIERDDWEFASRRLCSGVVIIIALTGERELLLVEQYRKPVQANTIELPAGLAGDRRELAGESLEQAARRELLEETGYRAGTLQCVLQGPVSAGMTDEQVYMFRAFDCHKTGRGGGDASEDITVHAVPVEQVADWLAGQTARGGQVDPKVYAALYCLDQETRP